MAQESGTSLEVALASLEQDVEAALRAAGSALKGLKALRKAVQEGDVRKLDTAMAAMPEAIQALDQQFSKARDGWSFDIDDHLSSGAFARELVEAGEEAGVRIFEQDDRLCCYPSLIRVLPGRQSIRIDKMQEGRLRPSLLVAHLKRNQGRPPRSRPEAFLECLYRAYLAKLLPADLVRMGRAIKLGDVYALLTLLPGQSREYGQPEFARDIYLLDRSGVARTKSGAVVTLHLDRGLTSASISVVTETGEHKRYLAISFTKPE